MAKKYKDSSIKNETGKTITTPSAYGSHAVLVIKELNEYEVLCEDEDGEYVTFKDRLDTGMADPKRWSRIRV